MTKLWLVRVTKSFLSLLDFAFVGTVLLTTIMRKSDILKQTQRHKLYL